MSRTNTNDPHPSQYPNTFYRVSVKAIIRDNEGRILVNKEGSSSSWGLPGGGWDHGETEREALARELEEEIGYTGHLTHNYARLLYSGLNQNTPGSFGLYTTSK